MTTLLITVGYAGLDEWHQSFVPLREPSVRDVMIDGTGALLAQVLVWAYAKIRPNPGSPALSSDSWSDLPPAVSTNPN
jgi:VanZ family protein